jgi:hypothetical protein
VTYYFRILNCNTYGLVLRLPIFLLAIDRTISNGFALGAFIEFLWLCLPVVTKGICTRCAWVGSMFLNDSLTLGSGQIHVVAVFFQRFVPYFRALQKFRLVEVPMKVATVPVAESSVMPGSSSSHPEIENMFML